VNIILVIASHPDEHSSIPGRIGRRGNPPDISNAMIEIATAFGLAMTIR